MFQENIDSELPNESRINILNRLYLLITISPIINRSPSTTSILQASLISRCILYRVHYAYTISSIIIELMKTQYMSYAFSKIIILIIM